MEYRDLIKGLTLLPIGGGSIGSILPGEAIADLRAKSGSSRTLKECGIRTFIKLNSSKKKWITPQMGKLKS